MTCNAPGPRLQSRGSGRPLLLIHPLGSSAHFWDPVLPRFAHCKVLTYDLPGHGERSVPTSGYEIDDLADELQKALETRLPGPELAQLAVVGLSLGGVIAIELAARLGDRLGAVVLADAIPVYPEHVRTQWRTRAGLVRSKGRAGLVELVEPTLTTWFGDNRARLDTEATATAEALVAMPPEGYAKACDALEIVDLRERLADVMAPTLVLCGDQDLPHFRESAPALAHGVVDGRLVWLSPAHHASVLEQPAQFVGAVDEFLGGIVPGSRR